MDRPTLTESNQKSSETLTPDHWLPVVISNVIPLLGVLFLDWSIGHIVILYWIENVILGLWNIPRILFAGDYLNKFKNLPLAVFFCIHYGIFCLVHGIFIVSLITFSDTNSFSTIGNENGIINAVSKFASFGLLLAIVTMFISTGWDLVKNYILNGENKKWSVGKAMGYPYAHIIVVHIAIFAGAFGAILLGASWALLTALIIGKTLIELKTKQKRQAKT